MQTSFIVFSCRSLKCTLPAIQFIFEQLRVAPPLTCHYPSQSQRSLTHYEYSSSSSCTFAFFFALSFSSTMSRLSSSQLRRNESFEERGVVDGPLDHVVHRTSYDERMNSPNVLPQAQHVNHLRCGNVHKLLHPLPWRKRLLFHAASCIA